MSCSQDEVKASSPVRPADARSLRAFREAIGPAAAPGLVVYAGRSVLRLADDCAAIPLDLL